MRYVYRILNGSVIVIITVIVQVNSHKRNDFGLYPDLMYIPVHFQKKPKLGNSKNPGFDGKRFKETTSFVRNGKILDSIHHSVHLRSNFYLQFKVFNKYSIEEIQHTK